VRALDQATNGVLVADVARWEELAAAGFVPAYDNARFVVMSRNGTRLPGP